MVAEAGQGLHTAAREDRHALMTLSPKRVRGLREDLEKASGGSVRGRRHKAALGAHRRQDMVYSLLYLRHYPSTLILVLRKTSGVV